MGKSITDRNTILPPQFTQQPTCSALEDFQILMEEMKTVAYLEKEWKTICDGDPSFVINLGREVLSLVESLKRKNMWFKEYSY